MSVWIHIFFNSVYYMLLLLLFILMFAFSPIGLSESPFKLVPVSLFDMSPSFFEHFLPYFVAGVHVYAPAPDFKLAMSPESPSSLFSGGWY